MPLAASEACAPATSSKATVVNLLALDDETLWRLYVDIPEQCRPKEKPKVHRPLVGAALKNKKRRIRFDGTIIMPKRPKPEAPPVVPVEQPPVFSEVCWVCCDLCSKWRRIPGNEDDLPERWACIDHPLGNVTCETPEEQMDADEMWDGATTAGTTRKQQKTTTTRPRNLRSPARTSAKTTPWRSRIFLATGTRIRRRTGRTNCKHVYTRVD